MNYKCQVIVKPQLEQVKASKMNFKKEWAEILMKAEETQTGEYMVNGTLIDAKERNGIVVLDKGVILSLPFECIKLDLS